MTLSRSRSKFVRDRFVNYYGIIDKIVSHSLDSFGKCRVTILQEKPFHNIGEYITQWLIWVWFDINDIEMSYISSSYRISTTTWGTHCCDKLDLLQVAEIFFISVYFIPSTVVHPLSKQLNRGLCSIFLLLRHIQIIDKNDSFFTKGWPINSLSSLLHLAIYDSLSLICTCLGWEG